MHIDMFNVLFQSLFTGYKIKLSKKQPNVKIFGFIYYISAIANKINASVLLGHGDD